MKAALPEALAARLAKLCGMFGSAAAGERATAAAMADRLLHQAGLTWLHVFDVEAQCVDDLAMIHFVFSRRHQLSDWEQRFIIDLEAKTGARRPLTDRQAAVLQRLARQLQAQQQRQGERQPSP